MTSKRSDDEKKAPSEASTSFKDLFADEAESRRIQLDPDFSAAVEHRALVVSTSALSTSALSPETKQASFVGKAVPGIPTTQQEEMTIPAKNWTLTEVPTLPECFPLERTAVFIPNVPVNQADIVTTRVSNILRELSIDAIYDDTKAKAKCMTPDGVDFRVRLFRGRNQYNHGIIVEVQRRFGFSVNFPNQTTAILDAAEGKSSHFVPYVPVLPEVSDSEEDEYDTRTSGSSSSLDFVSKMLNHPAPDAEYLGLKTLTSLTDPLKMGRRTAQKISVSLFEPSSDVGAKVVEYVEDETVDKDRSFGFRLMAMTVLSNAIQVVSGAIPTSLWDTLRPTFIKIIRSASDNPQMAYLATRSMEFHAHQDPDPSELHEVLMSARAVGRSCHADLRRAADMCLEKLR